MIGIINYYKRMIIANINLINKHSRFFLSVTVKSRVSASNIAIKKAQQFPNK